VKRDVIASVAEIAVLTEYAVGEVVGLANVVPIRTIWKRNDMEVYSTASVLKVAAKGCYSGQVLETACAEEELVCVLCD
jgi:hypothetical protein